MEEIFDISVQSQFICLLFTSLWSLLKKFIKHLEKIPKYIWNYVPYIHEDHSYKRQGILCLLLMSWQGSYTYKVGGILHLLISRCKIPITHKCNIHDSLSLMMYICLGS
jgi:hypothetical protein